jgi:bis(5'-nucleosidyl)-tetraphosphatase
MSRHIRQGGAIVYRRAGADVEVLIVRSKKKPVNWVFPKGHIKRGERRSEAAQREAREEAGVQGRLITPVGEPLRFDSDGELVSVQYYVLELTNLVEPQESREPTWLSIRAARSRLAHEDAKTLLDRAEPIIREEAALRWRPTAPSEVVAPEGSKEAEFRKLLLADHEHLAESYLRNEEDGERRVTFFMTFAAGAVAVLGFILDGEPQGLAANSTHPVVVVTLVVVGAIGVLTFRRVIARNAAGDRYKRRLHRIRRYFLDDPADPHLSFLPFNPFKLVNRPSPSWRSVGRGGWMETVAFVDSILAGALAAAIVPTSHPWWDVLVAAVAALVAWVVLLGWAARLTRLEEL